MKMLPSVRSAIAASTRSGASPITAAIPERPSGVSEARLAASIAMPRALAIGKMSAAPITPARCRAEYSPRLNPAKASPVTPCSPNTVAADRLARVTAIWVRSVARNASSVPSNSNCRRSMPVASEAIPNRSFTA